MIGKRLEVAHLWLHPNNLIKRERNRGGKEGKWEREKNREKWLKQRQEGSEQVREGKTEREEVKEERE